VLICWWWLSDWSFACLIAPVVTNTSVIFSSNEIQNGVVPAYPDCRGKWPLNECHCRLNVRHVMHLLQHRKRKIITKFAYIHHRASRNAVTLSRGEPWQHELFVGILCCAHFWNIWLIYIHTYIHLATCVGLLEAALNIRVMLTQWPLRCSVALCQQLKLYATISRDLLTGYETNMYLEPKLAISCLLLKLMRIIDEYLNWSAAHLVCNLLVSRLKYYLCCMFYWSFTQCLPLLPFLLEYCGMSNMIFPFPFRVSA